MLFHTWTFSIFLASVRPGYFLLRNTRYWIGWLMLASYVFYGRWNPYYLSLVFYSTVLDYCLVTLMERCPRQDAGEPGLRIRLRLDDRLLKAAFIGATVTTTGLLALALFGPATLSTKADWLMNDCGDMTRID